MWLANRWSAVLGCLLGFAALASTAAAQVIQYPKPAIYEDSKVFSLKINDQTVPVIGYSGDYDYAVAGLKGDDCDIEVTRLDGKSIGRAEVSPRKLKIKTVATGSRLNFRVEGPQYLIVDIDGIRRLSIAVDPPETDVPPASGPGIYNISDAKSPTRATWPCATASTSIGWTWAKTTASRLQFAEHRGACAAARVRPAVWRRSA